MSSPYVGELRAVGFNFAPVGWALCQGQTMAISENDVLFNLIGTTYGGDGQSTFQLPNLSGRVPLHQGTGPGGTVFVIGQAAGTEQVTLNTQQMPQHTHPLMASSVNGNTNLLQNQVLAGVSSSAYNAVTPNPGAVMNAGSLTMAGGNQPHDNRQPYLVINWIISLYGIYPTQN